MDIIKKIWLFSFREKKDVAALVITVILHVVAGVVLGFAIGLLGALPFAGTIISLVCGLIDLYITAGIVFCFLDYFKVIK